MSTKTEQEILQDQLAERAKHAVAKDAFMSTVSAARTADPKKRILVARWYIVIGTLWFGPGTAAVFNVFSAAVGFGGYLAMASAGANLLGRLMQISERLNDLMKEA